MVHHHGASSEPSQRGPESPDPCGHDHVAGKTAVAADKVTPSLPVAVPTPTIAAIVVFENVWALAATYHPPLRCITVPLVLRV
jgi:hypothetical protein